MDRQTSFERCFDSGYAGLEEGKDGLPEGVVGVQVELDCLLGLIFNYDFTR